MPKPPMEELFVVYKFVVLKSDEGNYLVLMLTVMWMMMMMMTMVMIMNEDNGRISQTLKQTNKNTKQ